MRRISIIAGILIGLAGSVCHGQDFIIELNAQRAARGLSLVAVDAALLPAAQANNALQRVHGLGHWSGHGFLEVAAIGYGTATGDLSAWVSSAAHAALIFAPNLVSVGYATDGYASTAVLAMGQAPVQCSRRAGTPPTPVQLPAAQAPPAPVYVGTTCAAPYRFATFQGFGRRRGFRCCHIFRRK